MPKVICDVHGGNIAPHACRHVADQVWTGQAPGRMTYVDLDGFFFMGWVCDVCLAALDGKGLQAYLASRKDREDYPPEADLDRFLDGLDLQPVCPKCLEMLAKTEGAEPGDAH